MTRSKKRPPVGKMSLAAMMRELERTAGKPRPKKKAPKKRKPSLVSKTIKKLKPVKKRPVRRGVKREEIGLFYKRGMKKNARRTISKKERRWIRRDLKRRGIDYDRIRFGEGTQNITATQELIVYLTKDREVYRLGYWVGPPEHKRGPELSHEMFNVDLKHWKDMQKWQKKWRAERQALIEKRRGKSPFTKRERQWCVDMFGEKHTKFDEEQWRRGFDSPWVSATKKTVRSIQRRERAKRKYGGKQK